MPSSNTGNFTQTLVRLTRKFLNVPTARDALESLTLGDTNAIGYLILREDLANWNWLFQMLLDPFNFVLNGSTIELDFHNVGTLLTLLNQSDLFVDGKFC